MTAILDVATPRRSPGRGASTVRGLVVVNRLLHRRADSRCRPSRARCQQVLGGLAAGLLEILVGRTVELEDVDTAVDEDGGRRELLQQCMRAHVGSRQRRAGAAGQGLAGLARRPGAQRKLDIVRRVGPSRR